MPRGNRGGRKRDDDAVAPRPDRPMVARRLCLLAGDAASQADEVADFYRGKSISLIVSTAAGGGYDIWARLLSRHFSRHIPGNPDVVVQNTPGSGGLRVMNQLNSVSPRDGTVLAIVHSTAPFTPLLEPQRASFDAKRYGWIGSMTRESSLCIAWGTAPGRRPSPISPTIS